MKISRVVFRDANRVKRKDGDLILPLQPETPAVHVFRILVMALALMGGGWGITGGTGYAATNGSDLTAAPVAARPPDTEKGILLNMPLDEGTGTNIMDRSPAARIFRVPGKAHWESNPPVLFFEGSDGRIAIPPAGLSARNISLAFWAKPETPRSATMVGVMRGPSGNGYNHGWVIYGEPQAGILQVHFDVKWSGSGEGSSSYSFGTVFPDRYTHLAVTYDHQAIVLYKNGQRILSTPATNDILYADTLDMLVGRGHMSTTLGWRGILADVKLYDRALSSNEVAALAADKKFTAVRLDTARVITYPTEYPEDQLIIPDFNLCGNLVQNPSFESGLHDWHGDIRLWQWINPEPYYEIDEHEAHTGNRSLKLRHFASEPAQPIAIVSFPAPMITGDRYTFSFYAKGAANAMIRPWIWTGQWGRFPKLDAVSCPAPAQEWKRYAFTFEAPNNAAAVAIGWDMKASNAMAWIDDIQLEPGTNATPFIMKPASMDLVTKHFDNLFQPGEEIGARLVIRGPKETDGKVRLETRDFTDEIVSRGDYPFRLDGAGRAEIAVPFEKQGGLPCGLYVLRADLELADGFKDYDYFRVGVIRYLANTHKHKNMFACYFQPSPLPDPETGARKMMELGFGAFRGLDQETPTKEVYALYARYGIKVFPGAFHHGESSTGPYGVTPPLTGRTYIDPALNPDVVFSNTYVFVKDRPWATEWILCNEPSDQMTERPEQLKTFMRYQRAAAEGIKKANPAAKVVSMPPCNMWPDGGIRLVDAFCKEGMLKFVDIVAIHPYRESPNGFDRDINLFLEMLDRHGFKGDVWFDEGINYQPYRLPAYGLEVTRFNDFYRLGAWSYDLSLGEQISAAYTARMYLQAFKYGNRVKMFCDTISFHFMDLARTYRLAFWVYNALGNILGNADFVQDIEVNDAVCGYLFRDERDRPVAVFWNVDKEVDDGLRNPALLSLPFKAAQNHEPSSADEVELLSMVGAPLKVASMDLIPVTRFPFFVRGRVGSMPAFGEKLAKIKADGSRTLVDLRLKPMNEKAMKVVVENRTTRPLEGKLEAELGGSKVVKDDVSLAPKREAVIPVPLPTPLKSFDQVKARVSCLIRGEKEPQTHEESFDVLFCQKVDQPIIADGDLSDWPAGSGLPLPLNFIEWVIGRQESPDAVAKYSTGVPWKGTNDLSAVIYTAWDRDHFYLALDVRDDVVWPGANPRECWKDDSVQVYFDCWADARNRAMQGYDNNDYVYTMTMATNGPVVYRELTPEWQLCFLEKGITREVQAGFRKTDHGCVYELIFPAKQLAPLELQAGRAFGFALLINDNDRDFRKRGLTLTPAGTEPYRRPDLWPLMILQEKQ